MYQLDTVLTRLRRSVTISKKSTFQIFLSGQSFMFFWWHNLLQCFVGYFSRFGSFHSLTLPHFMIGRALFLASVKACIQFYQSNYFRSWHGKCKTQQKLSKVCNPYHTVRTTYREFIKTNLLYIGKSISCVSSNKTKRFYNMFIFVKWQN